MDFAIHYGRPEDFPDFVTMPLLEGVMVPVASPEYLTRMGYKDLGDRSRLTLIHNVRTSWRTWLNRVAALGHKVDPRLAEGGMAFEDGHLALAACIAGEGVGMAPRTLVSSQLRAKFLVQLSGISTQEDMNYCILTPKSRQLSRNARILVDWMLSRPGTIRSAQ